ncbi:MAG: hypothetical protein JXC85_03615 [Candidatus Aenigmarchaeota archaeon]|nr:hypothetical protein [Candidatus Aenigmarchaeota archaeon]
MGNVKRIHIEIRYNSPWTAAVFFLGLLSIGTALNSIPRVIYYAHRGNPESRGMSNMPPLENREALGSVDGEFPIADIGRVFIDANNQNGNAPLTNMPGNERGFNQPLVTGTPCKCLDDYRKANDAILKRQISRQCDDLYRSDMRIGVDGLEQYR